MSGYLFNLDSIEALARCAESGTYATYVTEPNGYWVEAAEGTIADYAGMKPGDNVYFFVDRCIYGIGRLTNVQGRCCFNNFPAASLPHAIDYSQTEAQMLVDDGVKWTSSRPKRPRYQRWMCVFEPDPCFFLRGVDMDDALSSNPPAFRMLRAMWKLSFIKFDDEENQAFRDAVLRLNEQALDDGEAAFADRHGDTHTRLLKRMALPEFALDVATPLARCANGSRLKHEMSLEIALMNQLTRGDADTVKALGQWDYLSHQVIASPFKPIDYMDKMDLFGYAYLRGFRPTISRYLVAELKCGRASVDDLEQTMKYVDWVKDEYAHGDYSMVQAFLIASSFTDEVLELEPEIAQRTYTVQRRPARTEEWCNLALVRYYYDETASRVTLSEEQPQSTSSPNTVQIRFER